MESHINLKNMEDSLNSAAPQEGLKYENEMEERKVEPKSGKVVSDNIKDTNSRTDKTVEETVTIKVNPDNGIQNNDMEVGEIESKPGNLVADIKDTNDNSESRLDGLNENTNNILTAISDVEMDCISTVTNINITNNVEKTALRIGAQPAINTPSIHHPSDNVDMNTEQLGEKSESYAVESFPNADTKGKEEMSMLVLEAQPVTLKVEPDDGERNNINAGSTGVIKIKVETECNTQEAPIDYSRTGAKWDIKSEIQVNPPYEGDTTINSTDTVQGPLVVYSSSEKESDSEDSSSSTETSDSDSDGDAVAGQTGDVGKEMADDESFIPPPPKTKREVMLEDLPAVPLLDVKLSDDAEILPLGKIASFIGLLAVVQSNPDTPALNENTVLFKGTRQPIGVVFETFGPVASPFYTVRFNSDKDIEDQNLTLNTEIYFAPKQDDMTNYIFVLELRAMKGSDASWFNDEEPPKACLEFSDDEAERSSKKGKKAEKRKKRDNADTKEETIVSQNNRQGHSFADNRRSQNHNRHHQQHQQQIHGQQNIQNRHHNIQRTPHQNQHGNPVQRNSESQHFVPYSQQPYIPQSDSGEPHQGYGRFPHGGPAHRGRFRNNNYSHGDQRPNLNSFAPRHEMTRAQRPPSWGSNYPPQEYIGGAYQPGPPFAHTPQFGSTDHSHGQPPPPGTIRPLLGSQWREPRF